MVLVVVLLVVVVVAYMAARSIVAEADAHRTDTNDRWWDPMCQTCGAALSPTMLRCRDSAHPQRIANAWVIVGSIVGSLALTSAAPNYWLVPAYVTFGLLMILLTVTDLDTKLIPNRILLPGTVVSILLLLAGAVPAGLVGDLPRATLAGFVYFALMVVLALIARGGLGFGDVKLAFVIGVFAGFSSWAHLAVAILGSFVLGGVTSLALLATRRVGRKDSIPFGPFMTVAAVLALVFGQAIIDWYLR